ncbi:efflux transporter outer membrane subunit [Erythrobacter sp. WG]|uniref:efflux transporter outer membrane subunit n=1 Tax=Erythrobacter sp. WG TaxID=2985510 RepID=UPI00226DECEE|nr:TolC family protein [Erythrobacter sp. WG]MCX9147942.1 TolC family protein [Erythrobacter sp. WG]
MNTPLSRSRHTGLIALLGAGAVLSGCVFAGPIRPAEVAVPPAFEGERGALPAAALDRWWTAYGDPQLERLIETALARGADARAAEARLREARAIRRGALADYNPQGDLRAGAQGQNTELLRGGDFGIGNAPGAPGTGTGTDQGQGDQNPFLQQGLVRSANIGFDVSWELDLFGRRGAARREAEANLAAARFAYEASRASLAAQVADALFAARGLALEREDAAVTLRIQQQLRATAVTRAERGLGAETDVARIDADLAAAEAELARLDAELQANARALLVLTGTPFEPTATLPLEPLLAALPPTPDALPGELLARRPDVREAQARLAAAAGRLRLDELAFFPRVTLTPGVGLSDSRGGIFDATSFVWTIAAGITAPILDRPRLAAQLRGQEARTEQAVIAYEQAVQTAFSESDQALLRLAADRRRVTALTAGEVRARRAFEAAQQLYARGLTDLATLLDAERAYRASRTNAVQSQVQALRRSVQVFNALGGGWNPAAAPASSPPQQDTP